MDNNYKAEDIEVLSDSDHVRLRTAVYLGSTVIETFTVPLIKNNFEVKEISFVPAAFKALNEVIDNSLDEFTHIKQKNKTLSVDYDYDSGIITIKDNGRGIPIDKHSSGKYTPEVALGSLRAGRNFKDDTKMTGIVGQNGVGSSCTNMCSEKFDVTIIRDGKKYQQSFSEGIPSKPKITSTKSKKTGTSISFKLDPTIFEERIPLELVENRCHEIALFERKINVLFNGEVINLEEPKKYFTEQFNKCYTFISPDLEIHIVPNKSELENNCLTWINGSYLFNGGNCNNQIQNVFFGNVCDIFKKVDSKNIKKMSVNNSFMFIINGKVKNPKYDNQAKTRLTSPNLKSEITGLLDDKWKSFVRYYKETLDLIEQAAIAEQQDKMLKEVATNVKNAKKKNIPGFMDASFKKRQECSVLITEGLSAARMITSVRTNKIGILPLTGKINNVHGMNAKSLSKAGKLEGLFSALGLYPGQKATFENGLRFGNIILSVDADVDGGDIFCLLSNIFFQFWPELFKDGRIFRLDAPNIIAENKSGRKVYYQSLEAFEKNKDTKHKNDTITYLKGLGSMELDDWKELMGSSKYQLPITWDSELEDTFTLLFGPDTNKRKEWLTSTD